MKNADVQHTVSLFSVVTFKEYGFTYVTMDLTGYRTGSMNETLNSDL